MDTDGHEPPIRVMALHALAYCERLFYLEEVEELRVANDLVYAGRALHAARDGEDPSETEMRDLQVSSEHLGLLGRVDAVRTRDGSLVPYEHKRGRPRRLPGGAAAAWPSDELQIAAYALLLEEEFGRAVSEGRIRYHAENVTVRVPITPALRAEVGRAVARARELRAAVVRPPVTEDEHRCAHCSLAPVCLPEEERFARRPEEEPARLFPAGVERQTLHIVTPGARVGRSGERLVVQRSGEELLSRPVREIGALVLHGHAQLTTQALHLCAEHEVSVHWLTGGGRYIGALASGSGPVQRRIRQYQALTDPGNALRLARRLAQARMESQLRFLLRASRGEPAVRGMVSDAIATI